MSNAYLEKDEQDKDNLKNFSLGDLSSFIKLISHAKSGERFVLKATLLMATACICAVYSARALGQFVEEAVMKNDINAAYFYAPLIVALEIIAPALSWFGRKKLAFGSGIVILEIRKRLFDRVQNLPMSFFDRQPQGRVVTRLTHDVDGVENFFSGSLGRLISSVLLATISAVAMCLTDFKIGIILILGMIPACSIVFLTRHKVRFVNREMSKNSSILNSKLSEYLNGLKVIRSYGLESWTKEKYDESINNYTDSMLSANLLFSWSRPLVSFLCNMPMILLVFFGGREVLGGTMEVGIFVAFVRYCQKFFMPIMMITREVQVVQQALASSERINAFFLHKTEDEVLGKNGDIILDEVQNFQGDIQYKDVSMFYEKEKWILNGVDFSVPHGKSYALVGQTGHGKTTVVSLLLRLYDYQKGSILLDGMKLKDMERNSLRRVIGQVAQDPVLFKGTLRENLTVDSTLSDKDILECCEKTGLLSVMNSIELNLDSPIYEDGENLSAGQRQLISLTRVLLKDPKVLILDEATANIDPFYEKLVQKAIKVIMNGRTSLIIAHRLETIKDCDSILVFKHGKLVEQGNFNELMDLKGHYYSLQKSSLP